MYQHHSCGHIEPIFEDFVEIGVDAIIIQDMGILEMDLPPIPLFASTQTNNYSWEKVKFLEGVGIKRVGKLARRQMELFSGKKIFLDLHVSVKKGWSKNRDGLEDMGYIF